MFNFLTELIFPYRCLGCQVYLPGSYICGGCLAKMPVRVRLECVGCRKTVPGGITCPNCRPHYALDRVLVVSEYHDKLVAEAIKGLKYKFLPELAPPLAGLAMRFIQNQSALHRISFAGENFTVVPVPLHRRRENWRGFNQSALLARSLAEHYRLPYQEALKRDVHLTAQAQIKDRNARFENISGAFICAGDVSGRNILLVDDVCTTGATLNECARVLKNAGASEVTALVIARG